MKKEEIIKQAAYEFENSPGDPDINTIADFFKCGAEWRDANLWHDAQGDDLPEIDREVIVLCDNGKVCFGHRPNPDGWNGRNILTDEVTHYTPKTYGKSGWNIPDVCWWLDCNLPNIEEQQ